MPYLITVRAVNGSLVELLDDVKYLLSPQDLMAIDFVPELVVAGEYIASSLFCFSGSEGRHLNGNCLLCVRHSLPLPHSLSRTLPLSDSPYPTHSVSIFVFISVAISPSPLTLYLPLSLSRTQSLSLSLSLSLSPSLTFPLSCAHVLSRLCRCEKL
jgi:hypothetical protein